MWRSFWSRQDSYHVYALKETRRAAKHFRNPCLSHWRIISPSFGHNFGSWSALWFFCVWSDCGMNCLLLNHPWNHTFWISTYDTSDSLSFIECMYMPGINSFNSGLSSLFRVNHGKTHANRSLSHKKLDIIITGCFTGQQDCYFDSKVLSPSNRLNKVMQNDLKMF